MVELEHRSPGSEAGHHVTAVPQRDVSLRTHKHEHFKAHFTDLRTRRCDAERLLTVLSVSCRLRVPPVACACSGYTSRVGWESATLTLGPLTGVNRLDSTSSSSYRTGTFHTHADGGSGEAESLARTEVFDVEVAFARLPLPRSRLKSSSAARPTLAGLHPTEAGGESQRYKVLVSFNRKLTQSVFTLGCKRKANYIPALFEIPGAFWHHESCEATELCVHLCSLRQC